MSGYETNPFEDPTVDPFADRVVADARGRGAQTDNLHDFNPFANDHASTRTQPPAVLPASSQQTSQSTSSQSAAAGTEDILRRQEELERKAAELERRERTMQQSVQGQITVNNFPPLPACCPIKPCFYQDFVLDIPAEFQRIVKTVYYTWIAYSVIMFLNLVGALAQFIECLALDDSTQYSGITFGLAILYFVLFIPCSFICWYRPLYKAFRSDSSFNFFLFFFIFFFQVCVCVFQCLGVPGSGFVGIINGMSMVGSSHAVGGIMFIIGGLFALTAAVCFILLVRVHRLYRTTDASFAKAQQEFSQGVVTNRTVQQTATGVAASAARGAVNQYGSGGSSRY